jgi:hypothetical protein
MDVKRRLESPTYDGQTGKIMSSIANKFSHSSLTGSILNGESESQSIRLRLCFEILQTKEHGKAALAK